MEPETFAIDPMTPDPMTPDDVRFRIAAGRRILYREGCDSNVGGHLSARAMEGDGFWVTGFEYLDQTLPQNVAKLDFDLNPIVGAHELSPAVNFHSLIYQRRPDVNAIVHVHSHQKKEPTCSRHIGSLWKIEVLRIGSFRVVRLLRSFQLGDLAVKPLPTRRSLERR